MAKRTLCYGAPGLDIRLYQTGFDQFTVEYGKQVKAGLNYADAASELGACIMHAQACEGRLDNRTKAEARKAGDRKPYFSANAIDENQPQQQGDFRRRF